MGIVHAVGGDERLIVDHLACEGGWDASEVGLVEGKHNVKLDQRQSSQHTSRYYLGANYKSSEVSGQLEVRLLQIRLVNTLAAQMN